MKLFIFNCFFLRFAIKLLEDLVFFVVDVPNNGQNVLDTVIAKPNRERQKLMREQNILKQVGYMNFMYLHILLCVYRFYANSFTLNKFCCLQ